MAKIQLVELTTSTLHTFGDIAVTSGAFSLAKDVFAPLISALAGAFIGAFFAFWLESRGRLSQEKAMVLRRIELIRESLAQSVVQIERMVEV